MTCPALFGSIFAKNMLMGSTILNLPFCTQTFYRALKKFLDKNDIKQNWTSIYDDVNERLIEYIELQARLNSQYECGLTWNLLKEKAMLFAEQLGHYTQTFRAPSDNFIAQFWRKATKSFPNLMGKAWIIYQ